MQPPRWTERVEGEGSSLEIVVDAVDAERSERREMESFRRALSAPAKEHDVRVVDANGRTTSSSVDMLRAVRFVVRVAAAMAVAAVVGLLADLTTIRWMGSAWPIAFLLALFGPLVVSGVRHLQRLRKDEKVRDRFTLTLDDAGFRLKGSVASRTHALEELDHFEGERRLVLVSKDGRRDRLPVDLGATVHHVALADRLNEALVQVRASRGGYRGAGPRVEIRPHSVDDAGAEPLEEGAPDSGMRREGRMRP